jgi:hypothetical protein
MIRTRYYLLFWMNFVADLLWLFRSCIITDTVTWYNNKGRSPFNGRLSDFSSYIDSQISVHRKFKKIDQLIFRNAKEIYFNEKLEHCMEHLSLRSQTWNVLSGKKCSCMDSKINLNWYTANCCSNNYNLSFIHLDIYIAVTPFNFVYFFRLCTC